MSADEAFMSIPIECRTGEHPDRTTAPAIDQQDDAQDVLDVPQRDRLERLMTIAAWVSYSAMVTIAALIAYNVHLLGKIQ